MRPDFGLTLGVVFVRFLLCCLHLGACGLDGIDSTSNRCLVALEDIIVDSQSLVGGRKTRDHSGDVQS